MNQNQNQTEPKPMTIREAAKKASELPKWGYIDSVEVSIVNKGEGKHMVECCVYYRTRRFTAPTFELCFEQIPAAENAGMEFADRIIDL